MPDLDFCGNWQPGLAGINLGKFLIKRVIDVVRKDMPNISVRPFAHILPVATIVLKC